MRALEALTASAVTAAGGGIDVAAAARAAAVGSYGLEVALADTAAARGAGERLSLAAAQRIVIPPGAVGSRRLAAATRRALGKLAHRAPGSHSLGGTASASLDDFAAAMGAEIETAMGGGPGVYLAARRARRAAGARTEARAKADAAAPSFAPAIDARSAAMVHAARYFDKNKINNNNADFAAPVVAVTSTMAGIRLFDRARDYGARATAREVGALRDREALRAVPEINLRRGGGAGAGLGLLGGGGGHERERERAPSCDGLGDVSDVASARAVVMARLRAGLSYMPGAAPLSLSNPLPPALQPAIPIPSQTPTLLPVPSPLPPPLPPRHSPLAVGAKANAVAVGASFSGNAATSGAGAGPSSSPLMMSTVRGGRGGGGGAAMAAAVGGGSTRGRGGFTLASSSMSPTAPVVILVPARKTPSPLPAFSPSPVRNKNAAGSSPPPFFASLSMAMQQPALSPSALASSVLRPASPSLQERLSSLALERLGARIEAILEQDPAVFAKSQSVARRGGGGGGGGNVSFLAASQASAQALQDWGYSKN